MTMPPSFTLDTNCIVDVDEARPNAANILRLLELQKLNKLRIGLAVSSASERQKDNGFLSNFAEFNARRDKLGFGNCELLPCVGMFGVTFWNNCLWGSEETNNRERQIFACMFSTKAFEWAEAAMANDVDPEDKTNQVYLKWRNTRLDVKAFWAHENAGLDFFVTSDKEFLRLNRGFGKRNDYVIRPCDIPNYI